MTQSKFRHNMDRSQKHIEKKPNTHIHTEYIVYKSIYIKCKDRQKWPMVIDYKDQKSSYLWCVWRLRRAKRSFWNSGYILFFELGGGSVQFSSVTQLCPTLCDPMNHSTPGLSVHHQLPETTQTHVHWVSDAIQPSHPLSAPSPPILNLSHHQGLFKWVSSPYQAAKYWSFSFSISPSNVHQDLSPLGWTGWLSLQSKGLSRVFSNTTLQKHWKNANLNN